MPLSQGTLNRVAKGRAALLATLESNKENLVLQALRAMGGESLLTHSHPMAVTVVQPSSGVAPWITFQVDELRAGRFFRVAYSISLTSRGRPRELTRNSQGGLAHDSYGLTVGVPTPKPEALTGLDARGASPASTPKHKQSGAEMLAEERDRY